MKTRILPIILSMICYLGIHNGYLALFDEDQIDPLLVMPYSSKLYPESDQIALRRGIPYTNDQELSRLLEDYLS